MSVKTIEKTREKKIQGKIVTCNIGRKFVSKIDAMIEKHVTLNRSSFMRDAITQALYKILVEGQTKYLDALEENPITSNSYIVTLNLTPVQVEAIDLYIQAPASSTIRSRSDFLRYALVMFMRETDKFLLVVRGMTVAAVESRKVTPRKVIDMRRVPW